jgi:glycosyltransferase involved in cell wall biosynthesis
MQEKSKALISCIVPFYNDNDRIISVLDVLTHVKQIYKIICLDDGSDSNLTAQKIKKQFPAIEVIRHEKNHGKSEAIKSALSYVTTPYVLLFDADIINIIASEIEHILSFIYSDPSIDLLVLRRPEWWVHKILRTDILGAGERVLRTEDLNQIFSGKNPPTRFQLEYATNYYLMQHHKKVYWVPYSGKNVFKFQKIGFIRGILRDIWISYDFRKYKGFWFDIKSYFLFCRQEYK